MRLALGLGLGESRVRAGPKRSSAQYADWLALGACDYILTTGSGFSTSAQRYSAAVRTVFSQGGGYPASRRVLGAVRSGVKVL